MIDMEIPSTLMARHMLNAKIAACCTQDKDFRNNILQNPKAVISELTGIQMPDSVSVIVHEETPTILHLTIPEKVSRELSDDELTNISGGMFDILGIEDKTHKLVAKESEKFFKWIFGKK